MIEEIKEAFNKYSFLTLKDLLVLASISKLKIVKKGEHLINEGDLNYNVILVIKGLLRHYIIDKSGEEKTLLFVPEKHSTGSSNTIVNNKPAIENIIALEASIVIITDYRVTEKVSSDNPRLLKLQIQSFKLLLSEAVEHIKYYTILSPEERYLSFCNTYPNLEQRVKQKYLASYLGVTPSSLSRLRARLANQ